MLIVCSKEPVTITAGKFYSVPGDFCCCNIILFTLYLTLNLLTTTIVAPPSNASKWQTGFNSAFKGLMTLSIALSIQCQEAG